MDYTKPVETFGRIFESILNFDMICSSCEWKGTIEETELPMDRDDVLLCPKCLSVVKER